LDEGARRGVQGYEKSISSSALNWALLQSRFPMRQGASNRFPSLVDSRTTGLSGREGDSCQRRHWLSPRDCESESGDGWICNQCWGRYCRSTANGIPIYD
jgi:hypothetical protein